MRRAISVGLVMIGMALSGVSTSAKQSKPAVWLRVGPITAFEPAYVRVLTMVEPESANRLLTVEVDSGENYSSSAQTLDGDHSARSHYFDFKAMPAGDYLVKATVERIDGSHVVATGIFHVLGRNE